MQLAFILFSWFPHGGLQQDVVKIAKACLPDASITIFCMQWQGPHPEGVSVVQVPAKGFTRSSRRDSFVKAVQVMSRASEVVIGFNRMPGLDFYFAADACFAHKALGQRGWLYRLAPRTRQYLRWEQAVFGKDSSTRALLLSPLQHQQYTQYYQTAEERLIMLPPGISRHFIPTEASAQNRAQLRAELSLTDQDTLVLQVGSGFKSKGLDRSLSALAALPEAQRKHLHFIQIGQGNADEYRKQSQQLGLKHCHFLGGRDDVARYMWAADLLLHPSRSESAGMVILEAIVSGLPVLTTGACGYAFHVEQAGAGLVCPEPFRQETLNQLLQKMLEQDRSDWQKAGLNYGKTQELYDMPATVAALLTKADD